MPRIFLSLVFLRLFPQDHTVTRAYLFSFVHIPWNENSRLDPTKNSIVISIHNANCDCLIEKHAEKKIMQIDKESRDIDRRIAETSRRCETGSNEFYQAHIASVQVLLNSGP